MKFSARFPSWAAMAALLACDPSVPGETPCKEILGVEEKLYSQGNEELIVRDFFQDRRGGFFLDVGAAHFKRNSTTYYLDKHLGWSGIAIDALKEYAPDYAK